LLSKIDSDNKKSAFNLPERKPLGHLKTKSCLKGVYLIIKLSYIIPKNKSRPTKNTPE